VERVEKSFTERRGSSSGLIMSISEDENVVCIIGCDRSVTCCKSHLIHVLL
jgi:hypothetical protein